MTHDRAAAPTDSTKARPATHRTGFFFALRPPRRASSMRHTVRHTARQFLGQ
nr:MAG TPA: hypothetical protein [Caudoviricetes sp.]